VLDLGAKGSIRTQNKPFETMSLLIAVYFWNGTSRDADPMENLSEARTVLAKVVLLL